MTKEYLLIIVIIVCTGVICLFVAIAAKHIGELLGRCNRCFLLLLNENDVATLKREEMMGQQREELANISMAVDRIVDTIVPSYD